MKSYKLIMTCGTTAQNIVVVTKKPPVSNYAFFTLFVSRMRSAATCIIYGVLHAVFGTQITVETAVISYFTTAIARGPFTRVRDTSTRYGHSHLLPCPSASMSVLSMAVSLQCRKFCTCAAQIFLHVSTFSHSYQS